MALEKTLLVEVTTRWTAETTGAPAFDPSGAAAVFTAPAFSE
jgi:hypothetical protein